MVSDDGAVAVISDDAEFKKWMASESRAALVAFFQELNASCVGRPCLKVGEASGVCKRLMEMLGRIGAGCGAFEPVPGEPRRYGSPKFREWHAWLERSSCDLLREAVGDVAGHGRELRTRLCACFGNETRIDYGTGHEAAFLTFLLCLRRCGALGDDDVATGAVATGVFCEYVATCRVVQKCFGLEPAGARGVWALDPYQMLPFVFGSAQCVADPATDEAAGWGVPGTLDLAEGLDAKADESMFYQCVLFVRDSTAHSNASFGVVAPILFNCHAKPWHVVNRRLLRHFEAEVLGIRVVVQHMLFGRLFPADWRGAE